MCKVFVTFFVRIAEDTEGGFGKMKSFVRYLLHVGERSTIKYECGRIRVWYSALVRKPNLPEEELDLNVRLLRPYLPDGTPITTSIEEHNLRKTAETKVEEQAERIR